MAVTAVQLGAGGVAALPLAVALEGAPPAPPTATAVTVVLALGLTGTLLAFTLFAWAQARVPAELAGAFVNLEPLVGALTGAVVFHDAVGPAQVAGGAAILAGIALGALPRRRIAGRCTSGHAPRSRPRVSRNAPPGRATASPRAAALRQTARGSRRRARTPERRRARGSRSPAP